VAFADRAGFADKAGYSDKAGYADRAGTADRAAALDAAAAAAIAAQAAKLVKDGLPSVPAGQAHWVEPFEMGEGMRDFLEAGPFTLSARCRIDETIGGVGGQDQADIIISTTQSRSAFDGEDLLGRMDPDTNMESRQFVNTAVSPTGSAKFEASSDGLAIGGDGKLYIKGSYLFAGININGEPGRCKFGGYIYL
jgi:hypothetical protein